MSASATTTVGPKGQVVIPKPLRDAHHLVPGAKVEWEEGEGDTLLLHPAPATLVEEMARFAREEGLPGLRLDPHEPYESQMEERLGHLSR